MPHEPRLRELISVSDNIVLDALRLVQTMLCDEGYGPLRLLANLDISLAASMQVPGSSRGIIRIYITVFVPVHACCSYDVRK